MLCFIEHAAFKNVLHLAYTYMGSNYWFWMWCETWPLPQKHLSLWLQHLLPTLLRLLQAQLLCWWMWPPLCSLRNCSCLHLLLLKPPLQPSSTMTHSCWIIPLPHLPPWCRAPSLMPPGHGCLTPVTSAWWQSSCWWVSSCHLCLHAICVNPCLECYNTSDKPIMSLWCHLSIHIYNNMLFIKCFLKL